MQHLIPWCFFKLLQLHHKMILYFVNILIVTKYKYNEEKMKTIFTTKL